MKGNGNGRPRSLSLAGLPHRNSKGDGKGSDDGSAKGTALENLLVKVRQGKRKTFCKFQKTEREFI